MFIKNAIYRRTELHDKFGGQAQGGISTPTRHNIILLFTGDAGEQYGYSDGWSGDGVFFYTGEGQRGNMKFVRGNAAIIDHLENGKAIHLFAYVKKGHVKYIGQMICTGYHYRQAPDINGSDRQAIVFELATLDELVKSDELISDQVSTEEQKELELLSLKEIRKKALLDTAQGKTPAERKVIQYQRSRWLRLYTQQRAGGKCEGCGEVAPFITPDGTPYLEVHHIRRLSDGGPDHPRWVVAICPNCHRRAHYSHDAVSFNEYLSQVASGKEMLNDPFP